MVRRPWDCTIARLHLGAGKRLPSALSRIQPLPALHHHRRPRRRPRLVRLLSLSAD
jgi:hypothetical protein